MRAVISHLLSTGTPSTIIFLAVCWTMFWFLIYAKTCFLHTESAESVTSHLLNLSMPKDVEWHHHKNNYWCGNGSVFNITVNQLTVTVAYRSVTWIDNRRELLIDWFGWSHSDIWRSNASVFARGPFSASFPSSTASFLLYQTMCKIKHLGLDCLVENVLIIHLIFQFEIPITILSNIQWYL